LALEDREFVFDGSPKWSADYAIRAAAHKGLRPADVEEVHRDLKTSLGLAPQWWIIDRLTTLATMFTLARQAPDPRQLALWLSETARMLGDIPHDILAHSVDEAIRSCRHGFMPSVGEIRSHAEPLIAKRREQTERLTIMLAAWRGGHDCQASH